MVRERASDGPVSLRQSARVMSAMPFMMKSEERLER